MNTNETVYLDYAAATPLDADALQAMTPYFSERFYNPSSPYQPAIDVRREYEAAKGSIARSIGATTDEIVMTAGATESINLAFTATSGHSVVAAIEHQAVLGAAARGDYTAVAVEPTGRVDPQSVARAIRDDTEIVSIGLANNEIGTVQALREIAAAIETVRRERRKQGSTRQLLFHSDASQGLGALDVHVARLGVDLLTLNAGKVYGPKQVGLLWARRGVLLRPLVAGGGQERGVRSGTENVAGVIGFAAALEKAELLRKQESERLAALRDTFERRIIEAFPDVVLSGHRKYRLPHFMHISFPGVDAERVLFILESRGVFVATGSACAANKGTRSHVLEAIGLTDEVADGSIRITLGRQTDEAAIKRAGDELLAAVAREMERQR